MAEVICYDKQGCVAYSIEVGDTLEYVNGRISKGDKGYYKGLGIPYQGHFLAPDVQLSPDETLLEKSDVFYVGDYVRNRRFAGKTGIFQQQYQPQFEDFIGTCGVKELAIIENSMEFEKSSVEVLKSFKHDEINHQYYFLVDYKCARIPFMSSPDVVLLLDLIEYMIDTDWNFIWDKNAIDDIAANGMVTDVADVFRSADIKHKIGTVYAILYSLAAADFELYLKLIGKCGFDHSKQQDFVFNTLAILNRLGVDVRLLLKETGWDTYRSVVSEYLIVGKNCGDCSFVGLGDQIREKYKLSLS